MVGNLYRALVPKPLRYQIRLRLARHGSAERDFKHLTAPARQYQDAWKSRKIAYAHQRLARQSLRAMREGDIPDVYRAVAEALQLCDDGAGKIIEIGCGSGHYAAALPFLLGKPLDFTGLDYSEELIRLAKAEYPGVPFLTGDAMALGLPDLSFDTVISGGVILHLPDPVAAIRESARISRKWVIFNRTPVSDAPAAAFTKLAYGVRCMEHIFNEPDLQREFQAAGLELFSEATEREMSNPLTSAPAKYKTYVCRKV